LSNVINEFGVQVVDHCNLNCKGCLHFCYKGQTPYYYSTSQFETDIKRLHEFVNVRKFRFYGGEPLLHNNIADFIYVTKKEFPNAHLRILTNGLLLKKLNKNQLVTFRDLNVKIEWSVYPIFSKEKISEICCFLEKNEISYHLNYVKDFYICFHQEGDISPEFAYERCNGKNCHVLQDGKVSLCPAPMVEKIMKKFGFLGDISDGLLDLYSDDISTEKIKRFLDMPHRACSYCTAPRYFKWSEQKEDVSLSDWVAD